MDEPTNFLLQTFIPSGKVVKTENKKAASTKLC